MPRTKTSKHEKEYYRNPNTQLQVPRRRKGGKVKSRAGIEDVMDGAPADMQADDTPKAFLRMMRLKEEKMKIREANKVIKDTESKKNDKVENYKKTAESLKIQSGESLRDFNRRVDEALPMIRAKGGDIKRGDKKKMKARERAAKLNEEQRQKKGENDDGDDEEDGDRGRSKKGKGGKRDVSPDPWAVLESKKDKPKFGEYNDAPPELRLPRKLLKNVPKSAGSMARREMLEQERERIIAGYRQLKDKSKSAEDEEEEED